MGRTISIGAQSFEFLNMMNCFFSRTYEGRGELFEGLSIWEDEKYRALQGTDPVIFLSFADIKGETFEETKQGMKYALAKLYESHEYLRDGKGMGKRELDFFDSVSSDMADAVAVLALKYLSDYMSRYYGQKVLIFLDEYDTPLQEAYVYGYWKELAGFIRRMFNSAFKTNPSMERAIMTGITRVSKESIFSDLNNLEVVTTTSEKYADCFGFTEKEVFEALHEFSMSEDEEQVKQWYDGFTFGNIKDIYNPWSIINYLDKRKIGAYWANSSSNRLVNLLIRQGNARTKTIMEDLMKGGVLETELDEEIPFGYTLMRKNMRGKEEIIFDQLQKKPGAVWSMLLASGYLKVADRYFSNETRRFICCLKLTNWEMEMMFEDMVREWFGAEDVPYNDFIKALLLGDVEAMNGFMNDIALTTFSSFDIAESAAKNDAPERFHSVEATTMSLTRPNSSVCFYHGFVLGLMVELKSSYEVTSNRESGFGRYDIMLVPREMGQLDPMVIEFKVRKPRREASLEETVTVALQQIEDKEYDAVLVERGFEKERIRHYGFAFEGKQVLIG